MSEIAPGWYKDPADPTTQRYWDGDGWLGDPLPADATPPSGPPPTPSAAATPPVGLPAPGATVPPPSVGGHGPVPPPGGYGGPVRPPGGYGGPVPPPGWPYGYSYRYPRGGPAPRPHGLTLASPGARLVARLVDTLAISLLCVVANAWFAVQWWQAAGPTFREIYRRSMPGSTNTGELPQLPPEASTLLLMMFLVTTAVWFAYEVPGSANTGQTLGKWLVGIKVMRLDNDERLGFGRSWRRWSRLGLPTMLWYCAGIGLFLQAVDCLFVVIDRPLRQAIHDKAAGTVVVRTRRSRPSSATVPPRNTSAGGRHDRSDPR